MASATTVNTSVAAKALRAVLVAITEEAPMILEEAGIVIAAIAASRAPSPEKERETMMFGDNNEYDLSGDGGTKFIKPEINYLFNWIQHDYFVDGMYLGVGDIAMLEQISKYEWENKVGTFESEYPFFYAFENGGEFLVKAQVQIAGRGAYPLRPTDEKQKPAIMSMVKIIPAYHMYGGVNLNAVVDSTIIPAIFKAAQQAR